MAGKTQPQRRRYGFFRDQHGRRWGAVIETATNHPCETLMPKFSAPYYPPADCLDLSTDPEQQDRITINYSKWFGRTQQQHQDWTDLFYRIGRKHHESEFDPEHPSDAVLKEVGEKPFPLEAILVAERGDPWALGLSETRPVWADTLFPPKPTMADQLLAKLPGYDEPKPKGDGRRSKEPQGAAA